MTCLPVLMLHNPEPDAASRLESGLNARWWMVIILPSASCMTLLVPLPSINWMMPCSVPSAIRFPSGLNASAG